jgi:hypothetical protein
MHPEYTGVRPEMSTTGKAGKHRKMRHREMMKFVKDSEEGRVDVNGKVRSDKYTGIFAGDLGP